MFSNSLENCSLFKKIGLECSDPLFIFQPKKCPDNTTTWGKTNSKTKFACHPKLGYFGLPGVPAEPCPLDHFCINYYESISSNLGNIAPIRCPLSSPWAPLMSHQLSNCSTNMYSPCRAGYFMSIHLNNGSKKEISFSVPLIWKLTVTALLSPHQFKTVLKRKVFHKEEVLVQPTHIFQIMANQLCSITYCNVEPTQATFSFLIS
jgi:hypothetical protein